MVTNLKCDQRNVNCRLSTIATYLNINVVLKFVLKISAEVVKLANTLRSERSERKLLWVLVPPSAPVKDLLCGWKIWIRPLVMLQNKVLCDSFTKTGPVKGISKWKV